MCEMQEKETIWTSDPEEPTPKDCQLCNVQLLSILTQKEKEDAEIQKIFEKVFRRRAKWRKRAETAELNFVKLRAQFLEERERFDAERKALDDKRRDEVAKALGYKNIAEVIGLAQVDYKLICDELYSEVEALEYVKIKNREGEYISFVDALREVRGVEAAANKRAMKAEERMYEAFDSENRIKKQNKNLWLAVGILAPACAGLLFVVITSIIQTLC